MGEGVKEIFPFAWSPGAAGIWFPLLILVPIVGIVAYLFAAPRLVRFEVTPESLRIAGDLFYGRTIPRSELMMEDARVLDLTVHTEYKPTARTNGTGMPGYSAGWFRLQNGEKALVFVGDRQHVAMIPVESGYTLLVSVPDPYRFLAFLRESL